MSRMADKYRAILDTAPDSMVIVDQTGAISLINAQTEKLFGYKRNELIGKQIEVLLPERFRNDHSGKRAHFFTKPKTRGMGVGLDLYALRSDGTEFPVEISLSPFETCEGLFVSSAIRDISDRKKADAAQGLLAAIVRDTDDAIITRDENNFICTWNPAAERIFGYSEAEIVGQPLGVIVPPDLRKEAEAVTTAIMRRGEGIFGLQTIRLPKFGPMIDVSTTISPVRDSRGQVLGVSEILRDITQKNKDEEQLRIFAAVVESSTDFIGIFSPDMAPIFVNAAGCRMVGLDSMDGVKNTHVLDYFWPEDRAFIEAQALPILISTGKWSGECRFRNFKTGEPIHTMWNAFLVTNKEGKTLAWGTISPNLNQLKKAEKTLRDSHNEKEILLKEIHHRVKNNLNIISSLLELQALGFGEGKIRDAFIESRNRINSMALIHERLYQSKNLASIDFSSYVNNLVQDIYNSYGVSPETIQPKITIVDVNLDIDTTIPCSLIITELVSNSLKHAFRGRKSGHVFVALEPLKESVGGFELAVSDDGVGMPSGFQAQISNSLGLKLVHTLTQQIGGKWIGNSSESGTTVKIQFGGRVQECGSNALEQRSYNG